MFRKLMTFDAAKRLIQEIVKTELPSEEVSLLEAHNRVLQENIVSSINIPPFDRSTVDGYAVKASNTFGAEENRPVMLKLCGVVNVGEIPKMSIGKGEAVNIVTGAPIPEGADSVVMVEYTETENNKMLRVYRAVTKDQNIMKKGTDIKKDETVLRTGRLLGASEIGVLAALGLTRIKVFRAPIVAVLSTGGEITEPGKELPAGKIFDINSYSLSTGVLESGGTPFNLGVVPDDEKKLRKALKQALASADLVLTSGGVSVGPKDFAPQIVDSLGKPGLIISGIAVKPGKPTTIGLIGKKPVFSLPGHPTSALLMFHLLVRPIIKQMAGRSPTDAKTVKALAAARMFSAKGRRTFIMINLKRNISNNLIAEPVETGASGAITTLARADGYIEIPENQQFIEVDEEVSVTLLNDNP